MKTLLDAVTTGEAAMDMGENRSKWALYVTWSPGCTAGLVSILTAPTNDYTGTWARLCFVESDPGATYHLSQTAMILGSLKAKVENPVVGGTVTVQVFAGRD